jgi:hypothetical protein
VKLSFGNLLKTATIGASGEDPAYQAANAGDPTRPMKVWKSLTTSGTQRVVYDLGSATPLDVVSIVNANFASVLVEGNSADDWITPPYTHGVTLGLNPWNWRYQNTLYPIAFNYRYLALTIPNQATLDAASVYSLGGAWGGTIVTAPNGWRYGVKVATVFPSSDVGNESWTMRMQKGDPFAYIEASIQADSYLATMAIGDDLATWLTIVKRMFTHDVFFLDPDLGDPLQTFLVRLGASRLTAGGGTTQVAEPQWSLDAGQATAPMVFHEAMGG